MWKISLMQMKRARNWISNSFNIWYEQSHMKVTVYIHLVSMGIENRQQFTAKLLLEINNLFEIVLLYAAMKNFK